MDAIDGVIVTPLKKITNIKGDVLHGLKCNETSFFNFGEAYFSFINNKAIKGWKKHSKMTLNIIVPIGMIKFVLFDDRENSATKGVFFEVLLGEDNYKRLTIPPGIYTAFEGVGKSENMLLNIADILHDPEESENIEINSFEYKW